MNPLDEVCNEFTGCRHDWWATILVILAFLIWVKLTSK